MRFHYTYEHPEGFMSGIFYADDIDEAMEFFNSKIRLKQPNPTCRILIHRANNFSRRLKSVYQFLRWRVRRWKFDLGWETQ